MDKEQCLKLIELYGGYRHLWDAKSPDYTNRGLREDARRNISQEMNIPKNDLHKKMESLLGSYRREKSREKKSRTTGSGRGDVYVSKWYAIEAFSFMKDRNEPGITKDLLEGEITSQDSTVSQDRRDEDIPDTPDTSNSTMTTEESRQESTRPKKRAKVTVSQDRRDEDIQDTPDTSNSTMTTEESKQKSKRPKKQAKVNELDDFSENAISEALGLLQQCANDSDVSDKKDEYDVYGQHVANELRKYEKYTLASVKHAINKIIYEADMGFHQPYSGYNTQAYSYSGHDISYYTSPIPSHSPMPPTSPMPSNSPMPPTSPPSNSPMAPTSPPSNSPMPPTSPMPSNSPISPTSLMPPPPPPKASSD